jgi:hypothetical protein
VTIGVVLARYLQGENAERDDVLAVLRAQARGDWRAELAMLGPCRRDRACAATVRRSAARLRRRGAVKLLSVKSTTASSLTSVTGVIRVAWTVIGRLPVVQCVRVRRRVGIFAGVSVALLSLSAPIPNEADC